MRYRIAVIVFSFLGLFFLVQCKEKGEEKPENIKETSVAGFTTILVDETVFPIVEDLGLVFENEYKRAKIKLISKPESEILRLVNENKARIAIMARDLDSSEVNFYVKRQVNPRRTEFAVDAIAFIAGKNRADSIIRMDDVISVMKGQPNDKVKSLVFDNPNSSSVRSLKAVAGVTELSAKSVFSLKTNEEVVKYVAENDGAIGIIGVNWLLQPSKNLEPYIEKLSVLSVENVKLNEKERFVKPNQTNIADGSYPVTRKLFLLNFQGTAGLGMGFASYIAGDKGQRIILKSGLVPKRFPSREIAIRNELEKK
ncbi:substrate-binding domain-containing protein [Flavobacterium enshiense]|uniref:PstS family phosphate ABC transporter substrate-binding protein n=1 Tax=Flavobacterium enshiense TaxID=1341165 RepID=UPI00345D0092